MLTLLRVCYLLHSMQLLLLISSLVLGTPLLALSEAQTYYYSNPEAIGLGFSTAVVVYKTVRHRRVCFFLSVPTMYLYKLSAIL